MPVIFGCIWGLSGWLMIALFYFWLSSGSPAACVCGAICCGLVLATGIVGLFIHFSSRKDTLT